MTENYKFNQHKKCEFFPCHDIKTPDNFNCLFCYCPLYTLKEDCGGNFKYKNGIKDCSDCLIPHSKGGYDHIMSKMEKVMELAKK
ncbi:cysteine-rich small domain-containing protein [Dethiothermospora halolimnae]|uniref:cysteine-rich small domain-containing protein n=1 Tax=Dethiothermospora halolimnae TaxID=3114390 RepID=UPI003CCC43AD